MPKELGVARRDELMGTFPGEDVERASMLVRFLEGLGQLVPPKAPGKDTEISARQNETETGLEPAGGNGQSSETLFDTPISIDSDDLLAPEPLDAEMAHEPMSLDALVEPTSLDSVPDLTSPELDHLEEEEDFTDMPDLPPVSGSLPTVAPQPHEISPSMNRDTGLLEMDGAPPAVDASLNPEDLGVDPEDVETSIKDEDDEAEKITSKVERDNRRDDPDSNVRDTVNFYNQTQRMPGNTGKPEDSGVHESAHGTMPLGGGELASFDEPDLASPEPISLDAPEPFDAEEMELTAEPALMEPDLSADEPFASDEMPSDQLATDTADSEGSQKFRVADILARPHASDMEVPSSAGDTALEVPTETEVVAAAKSRAEPVPLPNPDVVGDFAASTDVLEPTDASERIVPEMAGPSDETVHGSHSGGLGRITDRVDAPEADADSALQISTDTNKVSVEPEAVPSHSGLTRLITPTDSGVVDPVDDEPESTDSSDDTAPDYAEIVSQTSPANVVSLQKRGHPDDTDHDTVDEEADNSSTRVRRITDALTNRLRAEKDETEALIAKAEKIARQLRDSSAASRTDLEAISFASGEEDDSQPETTLDDLLSAHEQKQTEDGVERQIPFDENAETLRHPVVSNEDDEVDTREIPSRVASFSRRDRVPTSAISSLLDRIEGKLGGAADDFEDMGDDATRRHSVSTVRDSRISDEHARVDINELVSASGRMREVLGESDEDSEFTSRRPATAPVAAPTSARESGTPLGKNLDSLWSEVSSRQTGVLQKESGRQVKVRNDAGIGWTQEALWLTLGLITVAAAAASSFFVILVFKIFT
ncbi:MAG: hypothetical protein ACYTDT_00940 [Planctomycetota bacterium]|jgi:hypothetical protein